MITVKNSTTYVISIAGQLIIAPLQIAKVDESNRGVAALIAEGALVPVVDAAAEAAKIQAEKDAWERAQLDADALAAKEKAEAAEALAKAEAEAQSEAARVTAEQAKVDAAAEAGAAKAPTKRTSKGA